MNRKILLGLALLTSALQASAASDLLNAAYDVSRGVFKDLNPVFIEQWKTTHGQTIKIDQSHGGSTKQARAVVDGLPADVVSMNSPLDIDLIAKSGLIPANWQQRLPHASSPSWSTILFVVRKGNPKNIRDWDDLVRSDVRLVLPNPKTSGNGRYSYLAAWQYALKRPGSNEDKARDFVAKLLANVPVLDTGGRGATTTFVQRRIGDVLLTFENEVRLTQQEFPAEGFEVIVPSLSVRADNPVALVDKVAAKKGNTEVAQAYLQFQFSEAAQDIYARNDLRPTDDKILKKYAGRFPALNLFTVDEAFGGWAQAQKTHFADGGTYDQISSRR